MGCDGMSASKLGVEVGSHNLYEDDPDQASFAVSDVGLHEDYDSWNIHGDICMLTLEGSISMGSNVGTIGLPSSMEEYAEGTICTVSGWGTTTEGGSLARVLQKVDVPVVSDDHCRDSCTRTTTAGTSTTTFACSLSRAQSAWDPTSEQSACPPAWKSTPVLTRAARTPARETLAVHSCAATSSPELSLGDTGAPRPATQECTHRPPTSSTGSTPTCKVYIVNSTRTYKPIYVIVNPSPQQIPSPIPKKKKKKKKKKSTLR